MVCERCIFAGINANSKGMLEWDEFHDAIVIDEMARCACLGTVWGINGGASVGGPPIDRYGTDAQKQKYLAPLLRGLQRHCLCITEPAGKQYPVRTYAG